MAYDVQNKTVLVTGANRGIGKAIVAGAIERGAKKVYAAVRRLESAQALVGQYGDQVTAIRLDLEDPQSIVDAAGIAGDVEVVINNAGVAGTTGPLADNAVENLQYEMNVNTYGLLRVANAFAPILKTNGGGVLDQLNSVVSLKAFADFATYSASKAASYSITQSLRDVLDHQGTLVISVHPGPIATDMANAVGLGDTAEPPSLVVDAIFDALRNGNFHVFPDSMAKQIGGAYESFAKAVVESAITEAGG